MRDGIIYHRIDAHGKQPELEDDECQILSEGTLHTSWQISQAACRKKKRINVLLLGVIQNLSALLVQRHSSNACIEKDCSLIGGESVREASGRDIDTGMGGDAVMKNLATNDSVLLNASDRLYISVAVEQVKTAFVGDFITHDEGELATAFAIQVPIIRATDEIGVVLGRDLGNPCDSGQNVIVIRVDRKEQGMQDSLSETGYEGEKKERKSKPVQRDSAEEF
jgi:hypothetical protein